MVTKHPVSVTGAIAAQVAHEMRASGVSRLSMSESAGIPRTTLNRRIDDVSPFTTFELEAICRVLGIPVSLIVARAEARVIRSAA